MSSGTGPGEWWDARFWQTPTDKDREKRRRRVNNNLDVPDRLYYSTDLTWRLYGESWCGVKMTPEWVTEHLDVTPAFLEYWRSLWLLSRQHVPRVATDQPGNDRHRFTKIDRDNPDCIERLKSLGPTWPSGGQ